MSWREIAAVRVLLAHRYHPIDVEQVWQIPTDAVPTLVRQLDRT